MMQNWMKEILERYGQSIVIRSGAGKLAAKAFLQPAVERREAEPFSMTELGSVDDRLWLYLGPVPLETKDSVVYGTRRFHVRSCRPYYVGEELIYWWAMLDAGKETGP